MSEHTFYEKNGQWWSTDPAVGSWDTKEQAEAEARRLALPTWGKRRLAMRIRHQPLTQVDVEVIGVWGIVKSREGYGAYQPYIVVHTSGAQTSGTFAVHGHAVALCEALAERWPNYLKELDNIQRFFDHGLYIGDNTSQLSLSGKDTVTIREFIRDFTRDPLPASEEYLEYLVAACQRERRDLKHREREVENATSKMQRCQEERDTQRLAYNTATAAWRKCYIDLHGVEPPLEAPEEGK